MERVGFSNSRDLTLVGHVYHADSDVVIIMAHGFCGDKSSGERFVEIAQALNLLKYNVLAFDFSGCGESDDDIISLGNMIDDLHSTIRFVKSIGFGRLALYGHSLGSSVCLRCWSEEIETMLFSGAWTAPIKYDWTKFYSQEQLREWRQEGRITDFVETEWRSRVVIDGELLLEFERVNQRELLARIKCPVLFVHGNCKDDSEELELLEGSRSGLSYLSDDSRIEIVEGANHTFQEHIGEVIALMSDWLSLHFKPIA